MASIRQAAAVDKPESAFGPLVSGHYVEPYGYAVYRSAGTQDWIIICTMDGRGYFGYDDAIIPLGQKDIVLIPPGTMHQYGTMQDSVWHLEWAHFVPRPYWIEWLRTIQGRDGPPVFHIDEDEKWQRILTAFARVLSDSLNFGPFADELALNGLEEVLLTLVRSIPGKDEPNLDPRVRWVLQHMVEHFSESITVTSLAEGVGLSPSRLSHLFKEQLQDSVTNTLIDIRLRRAARLLQFTSHKVSDIAHEVGFESAFYFTRKFTSKFGISPTDYRKSNNMREPD